MGHLPLTIHYGKVIPMRKKTNSRSRLREYPATISMAQLYKICHISKRTASHLLANGLIPSISSGKKTHTFRIAKADVITFLELREQEPERFIAPKGWYQASRLNLVKQRAHSPDEADAIRVQFGKLMNFYPDVMTIDDVSKFTGYGLSSVAMWCNKNRLRYFDMGSRYMIPKPYLLDFIMGPYFKGMRVRKPKTRTVREVDICIKETCESGEVSS
jgi:hypothetical protein